MLFSFIVVVVSFEVEHILIKFTLSLISFLFFIGDLNISFSLEIFVLIAVIVTTSFLSMLFPIPETEPTKLKGAEFAVHVVATLVLFNGLSTFWTLLCVSHYPSNIL